MLKQKDYFKYCTNCRSALDDKGNFKSCPKCGKEYYFNGVPCSAVLLTNNKDEVLLVKRASEPHKGWWDIPGGFVEADETLEEALHRELKEETGLLATDLKYEGSVYEEYHYNNEVIPIVGAIFSGKIKGSDIVKVADDVSDFKFVPKDKLDINTIAFENMREFLKTIL